MQIYVNHNFKNHLSKEVNSRNFISEIQILTKVKSISLERNKSRIHDCLWNRKNKTRKIIYHIIKKNGKPCMYVSTYMYIYVCLYAYKKQTYEQIYIPLTHPTPSINKFEVDEGVKCTRKNSRF